MSLKRVKAFLQIAEEELSAAKHLSGAATRNRYPTGTGVVHNISSDELAYLMAEGFR